MINDYRVVQKNDHVPFFGPPCIITMVILSAMLPQLWLELVTF